MGTSGFPVGACFFGALLCAPISAQVTQRVSLDSGGAQGNDASGEFAFSALSVISADGRYVAFTSTATNLVLGDTNGMYDVFVRDRETGTTQRVSVDSTGVEGDQNSVWPSISADGRYVAFWSYSTNLVLLDTNGDADIFVRDRQGGTTERASVDSNGMQGDNESIEPAISADGRYLAFRSYATNLVPNDTNWSSDIFVRDLQNGTTERVSVDSAGIAGSSQSLFASISADGRYVAFESLASNLVPGDTNFKQDVFVHDRQNGTTERMSVNSGGTEGNNSSREPFISGDGRVVAFWSQARNLVPGDTNDAEDVFVRDRQSGTTERVSTTSGGGQVLGESIAPSITTDGRYVAFVSWATNLVAGDTNGVADTFVHDRQSGTTERVSIGSGGTQGNGGSYSTSIASDGRYIVFWSNATNLVPEDTNSESDLFVRDRLGGTSFTSLCDPGMGSVIPCPCANSPSGFGRGCDNSSGTGGAILLASGGTYLSSDSLVFTTSEERPTALSILTQWTGTNPTGVIFGMGVRCTSGTLKRLYTKSAVGGSIAAPNFGEGDSQVSVRSAALGDTIPAGQSRWYLVYYRDPIVLGGCPASSTFNATQTGQVSWSP